MNTDLDPRLLRTFLAVAETLHFRRAAAQLNTTQSAVSQHIQELERRTGVVLVERDKRRVALTLAGTLFQQDSRELLAKAAAGVHRARAAARGLEGALSIGLIGAATFTVMPALVRRLAERAPGLSLRFHEMTATQQFQALREGDIDAGLVRAQPRTADLAIRTVWWEPILCLLPSGHRLLRQDSIAIADLEGEPLLNLARDQDPAAHDFYVGLFRGAGFEPRIVQEVSQIATILFVIAASRCVALGPDGWRVLRREGVELRPLAAPVPQVATRLVWNPRRVNPTLQQLLDVATPVPAPPCPG